MTVEEKREVTVYDRAFKTKALTLSDSIGTAEAARQLAIPKQTLRGWVVAVKAAEFRPIKRGPRPGAKITLPPAPEQRAIDFVKVQAAADEYLKHIAKTDAAVAADPFLKACPFCDYDHCELTVKDDTGRSHSTHGRALVECSNCGASGPHGLFGTMFVNEPTIEQARADAVRQWNARGETSAAAADGARFVYDLIVSAAESIAGELGFDVPGRPPEPEVEAQPDPEPEPAPELMTTEQLADYLGMAAVTLEGWRSNKRYALPFIRVGAKVMYNRADVNVWIAERRVETGKK